jgi:hypothetical protein
MKPIVVAPSILAADLRRLGEEVRAVDQAGDVLIGDRANVRLVYLKGDETLIARRIATRHEHFMPPGLLHSQFEALEEPGPDENPIIVSIEPKPREIVAQILSALNMVECAQPPKQTSLRSSVLGARTKP